MSVIYPRFICSIFVVIVSLMSDRLAEAKCEDYSKDLNCDHTDRHSNDNVQVADDVIVDGRIATLEQ